VDSLEHVDRGAWDALEHGSSPFLRYGFLRALELSGSIGGASGWHPIYLLAETDEEADPELVAAVPCFVKNHSYGEFIFDWSWAGAAERAGLSYYPKLVVAAPHTPATGPRLLLAPGANPERTTALLASAVRQVAEEVGCSSIHWLFTTAEEQARLRALGFAARASFQFHWHNRGYADFDDFLSRLTSRRRKQIRKERRRVYERIDEVSFVRGGDLEPRQLDALDRFYRSNAQRHGSIEYLEPGFFRYLAELCPEEMLFAAARRGGRIVAGALYLESGDTLYGRYWGCSEEIELLHFEVACYAGIERAIARGLARFEAGAQGEHKLLRGFDPTPTFSSHLLRNAELDAAVREFLVHETARVRARMSIYADCGPYKATPPG
jgi:predicted N-acyltransferase